jgi:signal transduction histidine kinase/ActR/RegA family two-component response regulator
MGRIRVVALVLVGALVLAGMAALSVVTIRSQARARDDVISRFADRGDLATQLLAGSMQVSSSRQGADAQVRLSGDPTEAALAAWEGEADPGIPYTALFDDRGQLLAVHPTTADPASEDSGRQALRLALEGQASSSGLVSSADGPVIEAYVPFPAGDGLRILVIGQPLDLIAAFAAGGLTDAAGVPGGAAYLTDGAGQLITAVGDGAAARAAAISEAVRAGRRAGRLGEHRLIVRAVPNTGLVVALTAPEEELTAELPSTTPPRLALGGFALALLAAFALGVRTVRDADRLDSARHVAEEARRRADEANLAKSEFLARMSHELRTPLNAILGFGQLLELEDLTADQRESTQQILKGGRRLLGLINEVIDISRIETGAQQLSPEPVLVEGAIRDAIDLIGPLADERGIHLRQDIPEDVRDLHVMADKQRLGQVLLNLLSNAVKYNAEQGTVSVSAVSDQGHVRVGVTDTGPGIPEDKISQLFTPFERLGAEQTSVEGTGLGLALSKALVEAMGGRVDVDTMMGNGTTFWVRLPATEPPSPGLPAESRREADPYTGHGTILYIEDNLANVRLIERLLAAHERVEVISAMTGELGIDLARQHAPDLILLDLHLPDLRGDEVLIRLRKDPRTREIPVVVLSADATPGQIERLRASGAHDYLTKPIDVAAFRALVGRLLEDRPS